MNIAIGICAKNEEAAIVPTLISVARAIQKAPTVNWKIYICCNGCTDQTETLARQWLSNNRDLDTVVLSLRQGNLVEAQRVVVEASQTFHPFAICFIDADVILDAHCLVYLADAIKQKGIEAVYAISRPIVRTKRSLIENALNLYDTKPAIFSTRHHLHGRVFIIRRWWIPKTDPALEVDDIFLSFFLLSQFGPRSIKRVSTACAEFRQVRNITDLYRMSKRREIEIEKCKILFPDLCKIPQNQINRKILWGRLFLQPPKEFWLWIYLLMARAFCHWRVKIERFISPSFRDIWQPSMSSKRTTTTPYLVLIEGLDCSGKKTLAYALQELFLQRGYSCTVNTGPLGSRFYNFLVKIVSLHQFPNFLRSFIYTFEGWNDHHGLQRFHSNIVLQISSPFRGWTYARVFRKRARLMVYRFLKSRYAHYDQVWYLTVPYPMRLKRHASQVATGENPDSIEKRFLGEAAFAQMDEYLENQLKKYYGVNGKFDTGVTGIDSIATIIADQTTRLLESHGR